MLVNVDILLDKKFLLHFTLLWEKKLYLKKAKDVKLYFSFQHSKVILKITHKTINNSSDFLTLHGHSFALELLVENVRKSFKTAFKNILLMIE